MRVIGGRARSLRLQCPKGLRIRPTTDMIRETVFGILGPRVAGATFCDLYAGCGSVGIEALSRGACRCVFVECQRDCVQALQANLQHTGLGECAVVVAARLPGAWGEVAREHGPFDMVFADPPYGAQGLEELVRRLVLCGEGLSIPALVMVQRSVRDRPLPGVQAQRVRRFGETIVEFFQVPQQGAQHE